MRRSRGSRGGTPQEKARGFGARHAPQFPKLKSWLRNKFLAYFFENDYFLFCGEKTNFGRNWLVLGEIIIFFSYSVVNFLISGQGYTKVAAVGR